MPLVPTGRLQIPTGVANVWIFLNEVNLGMVRWGSMATRESLRDDLAAHGVEKTSPKKEKFSLTANRADPMCRLAMQQTNAQTEKLRAKQSNTKLTAALLCSDDLQNST